MSVLDFDLHGPLRQVLGGIALRGRENPVLGAIGCAFGQAALIRSGSPADPDASVDVNLLRDWGEWAAISECVEACEPGGMVLVDGDLQPDWRIPSSWLAALMTMPPTI